MARSYKRPPLLNRPERVLQHGATEEDAGTRPWLGRWHWMLFPVGLFLCSRAALFSFSWLALTLTPFVGAETEQRVFMRQYPLVDGLYRWDSEWFFRIAERGYEVPMNTNFFPLLPLLARIVHLGTDIHLRFALLVVANVDSFAAYLMV
jgi:hypothetical protein